MTYIEQLQNDKRLLLDFFNAVNTWEAAEMKLENTAYKGDATRAANAARAKVCEYRTRINEMLNRKSSKEAVNA